LRISRGDNYSHTTISSCRSAFYTISPEGIEPHRCVCLKKWPGRLVTLQHLVLFRDTLIYFSYYRILNLLTSQRNRTFSEQSRLLLYHALRTSTCQTPSLTTQFKKWFSTSITYFDSHGLIMRCAGGRCAFKQIYFPYFLRY